MVRVIDAATLMYLSIWQNLAVFGVSQTFIYMENKDDSQTILD